MVEKYSNCKVFGDNFIIIINSGECGLEELSDVINLCVCILCFICDKGKIILKLCFFLDSGG